MAALIIFIKNPEKGKVKTRLAATVGDDKALAIYKALLQHTREIALATDVVKLLFYSTQIDRADMWQERDFHKFIQQGDDLGARMSNAFAEAFSQHDKVVIIGLDCASLTSDILATAFQALDHHDFVIGPATDGGYYLLGMRQFHPDLFSDMAWSTDNVFTETKKRIKKHGANCYILPLLSDIDHAEDWVQFGWPI